MVNEHLHVSLHVTLQAAFTSAAGIVFSVMDTYSLPSSLLFFPDISLSLLTLPFLSPGFDSYLRVFLHSSQVVIVIQVQATSDINLWLKI